MDADRTVRGDCRTTYFGYGKPGWKKIEVIPPGMLNTRFWVYNVDRRGRFIALILSNLNFNLESEYQLFFQTSKLLTL